MDRRLAIDAARRDVLAGLRQGGLIAVLVLAGLFIYFGSMCAWERWATPTPIVGGLERRLDFGEVKAPADVRQVAAWVVRAADNGRQPFALIDKRRAQLYVFEPGGQLLGTSPVLLGYAVSDRSVAGIGSRPIHQIRPQERTTPAGRFVSVPGRNTLGHDVVWVDYESAVSMHRVRPTDPRERRLERLATPTPADNRISSGCINVPVAFFDSIVWPTLGRGSALVYVLPEQRALEAYFPAAAKSSS